MSRLVNAIARALQAKREFDAVKHLNPSDERYIEAEVAYDARSNELEYAIKGLIHEDT